MIKKVLTIAGSDCSGGAGIQADIKTITVYKMYAMSVITAMTAQNTLGVCGISEVSPDFVGQQIDCVFSDIRPDAVKVGMVLNGEIIETIARKLLDYRAENIVVDPVMASTSGSNLLRNNAVEVLVSRLFPLAAVITPNIPEAEALCGFKIKGESDIVDAAKSISKCTKGAVLIKGGHLINGAADCLYENGGIQWFRAEWVDNPNSHGTGCTLSSAIACNLADGKRLSESVADAKMFVTEALKAGLDIGIGRGPLNHTYRINTEH